MSSHGGEEGRGAWRGGEQQERSVAQQNEGLYPGRGVGVMALHVQRGEALRRWGGGREGELVGEGEGGAKWNAELRSRLTCE